MDRFDRAKEAQGKTLSDTYLNCDVRYFNWQLFAEEVGKFEVVLIDPPWRIKGAQQNDSQFMFSNCRFSLEYNTMANSEIGRIPLHLLAGEGFIFLWILNSQLDASIEIMEGWGYELVEEVVWVKLKDEKISLTHGYYFMHSYELCLVGYKRSRGAQQRLQVRQGVSWNAVFAEVREKSQKPEDLYALIDIMFKGARKIEIFARNHNLRFGIFSVGNELGESYDKWLLRLECDQCGEALRSGCRRFKAKSRPNYDLCARCMAGKDRSAFFELANDVDENVRHEYVSCNHCGVEPIWGIRFQCVTCQDFDLCESTPSPTQAATTATWSPPSTRWTTSTSSWRCRSSATASTSTRASAPAATRTPSSASASPAPPAGTSTSVPLHPRRPEVLLRPPARLLQLRAPPQALAPAGGALRVAGAGRQALRVLRLQARGARGLLDVRELLQLLLLPQVLRRQSAIQEPLRQHPQAVPRPH